MHLVLFITVLCIMNPGFPYFDKVGGQCRMIDHGINIWTKAWDSLVHNTQPAWVRKGIDMVYPLVIKRGNGLSPINGGFNMTLIQKLALFHCYL